MTEEAERAAQVKKPESETPGFAIYVDTERYYQEALENSYAKIPLFWREDLLLSKKWFNDIRDTTPMVGAQMYEGLFYYAHPIRLG